MKFSLRLIFFIFSIFLIYYVVGKRFKGIFNLSKVETSENIILEKVSQLGNLELAKYHFKDIIEQKIAIDYLPDPKALLIVQGDAIGCINLKEITKENINFYGDTIIVQLPEPTICSFKIDHSKSKIYDTEYAFMNEDILFEEAYKKAEKSLQSAAIEGGILNQTKQNAQIVLKPLFENITNKPVVLKFKLESQLDRLK